MLHRPGRAAAALVGLVGSVIGIVLETRGIAWKYSEIGFGTLMLAWLLLSGFRPEWRRARFWMSMTAILAIHLAVWISLATRIDRFHFGPMLILLAVELVLGASLIAKAIPEDERIMLQYVDKW
jgi:hypothetical protein